MTGGKNLPITSINSFAEYILVSQNFWRVEKFSRQDDNTWIYSEVHNMDEVMEIDSVNCELSVKEIYRKVKFN